VQDGFGPSSGAATYADERRKRYGDDVEKVIRRIVGETPASATAGFVPGLGGFVTMPVDVPTNLAGSLS
jgi:hypothetical protein